MVCAERGAASHNYHSNAHQFKVSLTNSIRNSLMNTAYGSICTLIELSQLYIKNRYNQHTGTFFAGTVNWNELNELNEKMDFDERISN